MVKKGLLTRKEFHRVFLYKPLITRPQGLVKWVEFFADRVLIILAWQKKLLRASDKMNAFVIYCADAGYFKPFC